MITKKQYNESSYTKGLVLLTDEVKTQIIYMITKARITTMPKNLFDPMPQVIVTVAGEEQVLFEYYPDEISFTPGEFIGLTLAEAHELKFKKDKQYLQS